MQRKALLLGSTLLLAACWGSAAPQSTTAGTGGDAATSGPGSSTTTSSSGGPVTSSTSSTTSTGTGTGGTGGAAPCTATLVGGPQAAPYPFTIGGQMAWSHDDGYPAGYFHTFDALDVGGSKTHKVHVMLPRDYGPCDAGYPVVYFNDGGAIFWNGGAVNKSWKVPDTLQQLYGENAIPKVIAVAIEPYDRSYEYSHAPYSADGACCGAYQYANYVADHVKPFIDANYRTRTGRADTAIIGSSRGGLSSFYVATRRADVFGKAACMSPSFWAGLDPVFGGNFPGGPLANADLVTQVAGTLADAAKRPMLWIDWGLVRTGGFANDTIEAAATARGKEMVALLQGTYGYVNNKDLFWQEDPMGAHDEDSWARRFPDVMKALFGM